MILRHFLAIFGLLCDLVGAFLLSVPMIWKSRRVALQLIRTLHRTRFYMGRPAYYRRPPENNLPNDEAVMTARLRLMAVLTLFAIGFLIVAVRLVSVVMQKPSNRAVLTIDHPPSFTAYVSFLLLSGAALLACYFLVRTPYYVVKVSIWIARGNLEHNVGIVGLLILLLGFVVQAWLNLLQ